MNIKRIIGMLAASIVVATPALAHPSDDYDSGELSNSEYDYAQVITVEPLVHQVRVAVPQRECYSETHYLPVNDDGNGNSDYRRGTPAAGPMILGGLLGAVIGHQMDSRGSHRTGAIAGAVIGTAIAHDVAGRRASSALDDDQRELRAVDAEHCEVRAEEHFEQRVDGYRVTYRYHDRTYITQMPRDPGQRIRVRVSVDPVT